MSEGNKAVVRRFIEEVISQGNLQVADELLTEDFVFQVVSMGNQIERNGRQAFKDAIQSLHDAWTTIEARPIQMVSEGDLIACQVEIHGEGHRGPGTWRGIPPTGKHATWMGYRFFRLADGQIAEIRSMEDELGLLSQLGANLTLPQSER